MESTSEKLTKVLIGFVLVVLVVKNATCSGLFEARSHRGKGYYVAIPEGWKKLKDRKDVVYPEGVDVVTFTPKYYNLDLGHPDVYVTIFTKKLSTPIWIEDEFPGILKSITDANNKIMDKGQIKIDNVISEWLVYHDQKTPALVLEFYMVTENSVFYKIQYSADPDKFNVERKKFEELKESFRFRFTAF